MPTMYQRPQRNFYLFPRDLALGSFPQDVPVYQKRFYVASAALGLMKTGSDLSVLSTEVINDDVLF
jgi:hypothetical protein